MWGYSWTCVLRQPLMFCLRAEEWRNGERAFSWLRKVFFLAWRDAEQEWRLPKDASQIDDLKAIFSTISRHSTHVSQGFRVSWRHFQVTFHDLDRSLSPLYRDLQVTLNRTRLTPALTFRNGWCRRRKCLLISPGFSLQSMASL